MNNNYNINNIYENLSHYGIDKKFIEKVLLPDWWNDEIVYSEAGYLQTASIIAKNLGIEITNLLNNQPLVPKYIHKIKFKTAKNVTISTTDIWPQSIAVKINDLLEQSFNKEFEELSLNVSKIRAEIINNYNSITLSHILDFLWFYGIPVLHISEFPLGLKKMDGMVIKTEKRPVIIISKNRKHDAWLLFIIAHELGHIVKRHIENKEDVIYDTDLENEDIDSEEREATEFALELITGNINPNFITSTIDSAFKLYNLSKQAGTQFKMDPGIVCLNYAFRHKNYPIAESTLKMLYPNANAILQVKEKMKSNLDFSSLSEENLDFFFRLTSLSGE
jgi:Zn-dependent peptidase ImmA (M78 family)